MKFLIKGHDNVDVKTLINGLGGKHKKKIGKLNVHAIEFDGNIEQLKQHKDIVYVEEDCLVPPLLIPNDPYFQYEYHHTILGTLGAWDITQGSGIIAAVLDTGVDSTQPDLSLVPGWNVVSDNTDTEPVHPHGTAVAGTIAAKANNNFSVAGMAPQAQIMPVRVTNDPAGNAYWSDVADAIVWATDHGAHVINNSFQSWVSSAIQDAAKYAFDKGVVVVISAGNTSAFEGSLGSPYILVVGATDSADTIAFFSTFGPGVDVVAPGVGIYTTKPGGATSAWTGTSFSAPVVAGLAALCKSANPTLTPAQIMQLIVENAVDKGNVGRDDFYGSGRVDALKTVVAAKAFAQPPVYVDLTPPFIAITSPYDGYRVPFRGSLSVSASATDNIGIKNIALYLDGNFRTAVNGSSLSWSINVKQLSSGYHTLKVVATDTSGNISTSQISVYK